jgi:hypothetical protein
MIRVPPWPDEPALVFVIAGRAGGLRSGGASLGGDLVGVRSSERAFRQPQRPVEKQDVKMRSRSSKIRGDEPLDWAP